MALSLNRVTLVGRLTKDPQSLGDKGAAFSLATNSQHKTKDGSRITRADFHEIRAWGNLAGLSLEYLKKGMLVFVEGELRHNKHEDKIYSEVHINNLQFMEKKNG